MQPCGGAPCPEAVASVTVTSSTGLQLMVGDTMRLVATARDAAGAEVTGRTFAWQSSAVQVASVNSSGLVTALGQGNAAIAATSDQKIGSASVAVQAPPAPSTGGLRMISTTVGRNLDPDGYTFVLNGGTAQAIAINDTLTINGLSPGPQSLTLDGLATNCNPFSSPPISASVTVGAVTDVPLGVECLGAIPGDVSLTFVRLMLVEPFTSNIAGLLSGSDSVEDFTFNPARDRAPDWSPDGSQLAFTRNDMIHVVNADGTGLRSFGPRGLGTNPAWSPDGSTIAYDNGGKFLVFAPNGVGETMIGEGIQPAWSPDGARLAAEIEGASAFEGDIVVMNADGSGVVNITQAPELLDREPTWSPDGLRIAFRRLNRVEIGGYELWVIDADGSNEAKLLAMGGAQLEPNWLPDNRILFGDNSSGTIMALDMGAGGTVSQLTNEPGFHHSGPAWRPGP